MVSLSQFARSLDGHVPRHWLALAANLVLSTRRGDDRRFEADPRGYWVNRQPEMTIVSPDLHTSHHDQVRTATLGTWCQIYTPVAGDIVFDIGAGIGEETVIFSELVGNSGRVVSIEAHPRTFECLKETIARSGLNNVVPIHCAIADTDGLFRISNIDEHLNNRLVDTGGFEVPARSLDSLAVELGFPSIDFLKMNIEGAEDPATAGMQAVAARVRHGTISCHDFIAEGGGSETFRTRERVGATLERLGFKLSRRTGAEKPWLRDIIYADRPAPGDVHR